MAVTASSATTGPIIPPSIAMLMYSYYTELSVGKLFIGGFIPGVLIGLGLMAVHAIYYRIRGYNIPVTQFSLKRVWKEGLASMGALIMPLIILFGIVFGIVTPTESGIVATVYGLFYGFFISKKLTWRKIPLEESVKVMIPFTLVIMGAAVLVLLIPSMSLALNRVFFP